MSVSETAEELAQTAIQFGLYLNPADVVTKRLPDGWGILPRRWGRYSYDYTIISPCCPGWSGGRMDSKRRTIRAARRDIKRHRAECTRAGNASPQ